MNKIYNTAIIGGGASGIILAIELCRQGISGEDVLLIEGQDRIGKKLLATGNGQCNLGNSDLSADHYHGDKGIISRFIEQANAVDLDEYLYSLGIPVVTEDNGKKYPVSKQASAVIDTLRAQLSRYNVCVQTDFKVNKITYNNGTFTVIGQNAKVQAKTVVLATGGSAGKQFGTDGTSYALAENFSHQKTALYPSLVQLKTETEKIRGLKGLKEYATVKAYDGDRYLAQSTGDVLFTEFGVSGSAVFYVSAYLADVKAPKLVIEFLPKFSEAETAKLIADRKKFSGDDGDKALNCLINKRVGQAVYKTAGTDTAKGLANALKNFTLKVTGTLGFNYAQVTKGGIKGDGVNPETYESKNQKGLYIVGEMLNVDGDCGGYNLAFAFTSAITCARAIAQN